MPPPQQSHLFRSRVARTRQTKPVGSRRDVWVAILLMPLSWQRLSDCQGELGRSAEAARLAGWRCERVRQVLTTSAVSGSACHPACHQPCRRRVAWFTSAVISGRLTVVAPGRGRRWPSWPSHGLRGRRARAAHRLRDSQICHGLASVAHVCRRGRQTGGSVTLESVAGVCPWAVMVAASRTRLPWRRACRSSLRALCPGPGTSDAFRARPSLGGSRDQAVRRQPFPPSALPPERASIAP